MREWMISTSGTEPVPARDIAERTHLPLTRPARRSATYLLTGNGQPQMAACAQAALHAGHHVVLLPGRATGPLPDGILVHIEPERVRADAFTGPGARRGWDVAMYSSGSTTGTPRGYGFTRAQLDQVAGWYERIYQVTADSIIVTALPAVYNFTFVAGVLLAARLGARLHLSRSLRQVLRDARELAAAADRLVVLANPVVLDQADVTGPLPRQVLVDSGGAPLSTTAVMEYRNRGVDLREGYGLTETASLTHFDAEGTTSSLGTVGAAMPGVCTGIDITTGDPIVVLASPAIGIPLDPDEPNPMGLLRTTDLGAIDGNGRLRLLGRLDDEQIGGLWPRDTLDILGPVLHRSCALIRHSGGRVLIHLLTDVGDGAIAIRQRAADALGLPVRQVRVTEQGRQRLLHSVKLTRFPRR